MSLKRKLATLAAAVAVFGVLPLGAPAANAAGKCDATVQAFFWYGTTANGTTVSNPVSLNAAALGCTASSTAGADVDLFYVYPGALLVSGRDNQAVCRDSVGTIAGLGLNKTEVWKAPASCTDGTPTVGTGGAQSVRYPMDPTQVDGVLDVSASGSGVQYRTVTR